MQQAVHTAFQRNEGAEIGQPGYFTLVNAAFPVLGNYIVPGIRESILKDKVMRLFSQSRLMIIASMVVPGA